MKNKIMNRKFSITYLNFTYVGFILCVVLCACNPSVEAGQVWTKSYFVDNPFEQTQTDTLYILEIKGDWMKYKKGNRIDSDRLSLFKRNSKRIK